MIRRADDPVWERAFRRVMTMNLRCETCGKKFRYTPSKTGGNKPRYCSDECRHYGYNALRRGEREAFT